LDLVGSGYGPVAGSCEYGDEPSDSGATDLVMFMYFHVLSKKMFIPGTETLKIFRTNNFNKVQFIYIRTVRGSNIRSHMCYHNEVSQFYSVSSDKCLVTTWT
jgi:hypothetical protein